MHNYEIVFIIDPTEKAIEQVEKKLVDFLVDSKNLKINRWGLKKFAYPIKKHTNGHYIQINCQLSAAVIAALPAKLNLVRPLLRYLIINLDNEKKFRYKERSSLKVEETTLSKPASIQTTATTSQINETTSASEPAAKKTVDETKNQS